MIVILEFLRTKLGQYVLIGGAVATAGLVVISHERGVGVKKERARVEKQGEKTDAKAQTKRADAERNPDLGRWYRD